VIEISFDEAMRMGHNYVGTEHLLLGLLIEGEGIAAHVLEDLGVTVEKARAEIERQLRAALGSDQPAVPSMERQPFMDIMATFPSGVVVLTAFGEDGRPLGLTVSAFSAVSLDPPLVLACVDKTSNTLPAVQRAGAFTANILAAGREKLAQRMATKLSDKFDGIAWNSPESKLGGPMLFEDAAAIAVCTLRNTIEAGDHWILVGRVTEGSHRADVSPMVFTRRKYF
jgi:flavin reductase (DIM6/NTAB) family NADH-FMN oxidoreductase RutF